MCVPLCVCVICSFTATLWLHYCFAQSMCVCLLLLFFVAWIGSYIDAILFLFCPFFPFHFKCKQNIHFITLVRLGRFVMRNRRKKKYGFSANSFLCSCEHICTYMCHALWIVNCWRARPMVSTIKMTHLKRNCAIKKFQLLIYANKSQYLQFSDFVCHFPAGLFMRITEVKPSLRKSKSHICIILRLMKTLIIKFEYEIYQ